MNRVREARNSWVAALPVDATSDREWSPKVCCISIKIPQVKLKAKLLRTAKMSPGKRSGMMKSSTSFDEYIGLSRVHLMSSKYALADSMRRRNCIPPTGAVADLWGLLRAKGQDGHSQSLQLRQTSSRLIRQSRGVCCTTFHLSCVFPFSALQQASDQ